MILPFQAGALRRSPLLLFLALLTLWSCASIPSESVELSRMVGTGIGQSRTAHLATLDAFYKRLKADNDAWVLNTFLPRAIHNVKEGLDAACSADPDCEEIEMTEEDFATLTKGVIQFRDSIQAALDDNRDDMFRLVNDHYNSLQAANAGVTGLLASAVDVKDATRDATQTISGLTGIEIDTDQIEKTVFGFLEKAGQAGTRVSDLEDQLADIVKKVKE